MLRRNPKLLEATQSIDDFIQKPKSILAERWKHVSSKKQPKVSKVGKRK